MNEAIQLGAKKGYGYGKCHDLELRQTRNYSSESSPDGCTESTPGQRNVHHRIGKDHPYIS